MSRIHQRISIDQARQDFQVVGGRRQDLGAIYDTQTYAAAGQTVLNFFRQSYADAGKNKDLTNLKRGGQMPHNEAILVRAIALRFLPGVDNLKLDGDSSYIKDVVAFMKSGRVHIKTNGVDVVEDGPLSLFPAETRLDLSFGIDDNRAAGAGQFAVGQHGDVVGRVYMPEPFLLDKNQAFDAALEWDTAVALPSGVAGKVIMRLIGDKYVNI